MASSTRWEVLTLSDRDFVRWRRSTSRSAIGREVGVDGGLLLANSQVRTSLAAGRHTYRPHLLSWTAADGGRVVGGGRCAYARQSLPSWYSPGH